MCSVSMPSAWPHAGGSRKQSIAAHNDLAGMVIPVSETTSVNRIPQTCWRKPSTRWLPIWKEKAAGNRAGPANEGRGKPGRREQQHACHGPQQMTAGAGQIASLLLARRADVHVDFHAHLHFDDLRSFPGHSLLPRDLAQYQRRLERKSAARPTQALRDFEGATGHLIKRSSARPDGLFSSFASSVPSPSRSAARKRCSTTA